MWHPVCDSFNPYEEVKQTAEESKEDTQES